MTALLRRAAAAALLCLAAIAVEGCAALFHQRAPVPGVREGEWAAARTARTRRASVYDGLIHRATGTVTYVGPAEREIRARRLAEWQGWPDPELEARLAADRALAGKEEEFILALYTAERAVNDLDSPASVWRATVVVDGLTLVPIKVEGLSADATVTGLYPYVGVFDQVYRLRFPSPPGGPLSGRAFQLDVASALGRLAFDFKGPEEDAETQKPLEPIRDR